MPEITVTSLGSRDPAPVKPPAHWIGNPPTHFQNPWPSARDLGLAAIFKTRFGPGRNLVPVPSSRDELVTVQVPHWGRTQRGWLDGLKATWLGHASFLVETACEPSAEATGLTTLNTAERLECRGVRILFDPVFSERTSPFTFLGPKRYTPTPCTVDELPLVDLVVISHDHYDHLDLATLRALQEKQQRAGHPLHFLAGLGNKASLLSLGPAIAPSQIHECDWWDARDITVPDIGRVRLTCTPSQHNSGRGIFDKGKTLWCSWALEDLQSGKRLFFAGDTGYQCQGAPEPCPAFEQIGRTLGPFEMALLPIGLYSPRAALGSVHACPEDSLEIHKAVRSRYSVGMHYGTVRGGLSAQYEDVREPPRRWRDACEKEGKWETECGLCNVGETVIV